MSVFARLLKEAVDELDNDLTADKAFSKEPIEDTSGAFSKADEETTDPLEGESEEEETVEVSGIVKDTQDLIMSILDALEQEALAQGETIGEDDSPDIALELLYKFLPTMPTEQVQTIYDELSEYYEMETDEEEEDYFEEPKKETDELDYEEEVKSESLQVKKKF
jgi:hypothetical protein